MTLQKTANLVALVVIATGFSMLMGVNANTIQDIKLSGSKSTMNQVNVPVGTTNVLRVINDNDTPMHFKIKSLDIDTEIPARSNKNFRVNTAVLPDRYLRYDAEPCSVNVVANRGDNAVSVNAMGSSVVNDEQTTDDLNRIIHYNTEYHSETKSEPVYQAASTSEAPAAASEPAAQVAANHEPQVMRQAVMVAPRIRGYW